MALLLWLGVSCRPTPELPKLYPVPDFSLQDQHGRTVNLASLQGKTWIVSFFFTSCPTICPRLTAQMKELNEQLGGAKSSLQFVSISVDPETDTPERLLAYAKHHGADKANWLFLTGDADVVRETVVDGFKQAMEAHPSNPADILHGSHFILVGPEGHIRGYYGSSHPEKLEELQWHARSLAKR